MLIQHDIMEVGIDLVSVRKEWKAVVHCALMVLV